MGAKRDLTKRVHNVLQERFPGSEIEVDRFYGAQKLHGQIIWSGFGARDQLERQMMVYDALREELGADAQGVSIIFAYTPQEVKIMHAV